MPVPDTTATERCGSQCSRLALPVELERRGADHDGGVRVVLLERGERLDGLAEALLVGEERRAARAARRRRRRAGTGAARRRAPPRSPSAGAVVGARAADVVDRRVVLGAQPLQHLARRSARPRRRRCAGSARAARRGTGRSGSERPCASHAGSARNAGIVSGSQLTSSVKRGSPTLSTSASVAGAGSWPTCSRVAQRSARLSSRAPRSSSSASAISCENGSHSRPPRSSARRELVRQLAGDRLQHERAAPVEPRGADAPDPAARRLGQPRASPRRRDEQRRVALDHALDVRRGGVGLRRPPLLRVPVEAAARGSRARRRRCRRGRGTRTRRARGRGGRRGARRCERAPRGARDRLTVARR